MSTGTTLAPAEFALRALVAAGHVTQEQVDAAMALPGAPKPRKPLTRSQIAAASRDAQILFCLDKQPTYEVALARAVEAEHGIGP